jgi:hypothetical protein
MRQPRVDRQCEQQRRHQQGRHQLRRAQAECRALQCEAAGGDIRLVHPRPPVVFEKSVGTCIAKGVGMGSGDLFE